jgi:citrate synthase
MHDAAAGKARRRHIFDTTEQQEGEIRMTNPTNPDHVTVTYGDTHLDASVTRSTEGVSGFDISKLMSTTGLVSLDPGYTNTGSTTSEITFINGAEGILRYRGYPIEQLAEHSSYLETAYLLIYGALPTSAQLKDFTERVEAQTAVPEQLGALFDAVPAGAHPMPVLAAAVSALSTYHQDILDPYDAKSVEAATVRLIGALPTLAAWAYKATTGGARVAADPSLGLVPNFLNMTFGAEAAGDATLTSALDTLLLLHADHEQNCSTSTVRMVGSADSNLFVSISAGIQALFGPLHGGANQAVLEMLSTIRDQNGGDISSFVERVKAKEPGVKLMGFGHRVYKNYDPRAKIVKATADEILSKLGANDELLDLAKQLEAVALSDEYFISRKLYPNVDFYTGLIYKAMGFPTTMFTVLFAVGRLPGWIAQWREMITDPAKKICRPRQVYVGSGARDYVEASAR